MERETNYAAVGAFVLLVTLLGALFVYWYSDSRERRDYDRYEIYFNGSVSGLDKGASVRYLGVAVGRVYDLRIDPRDAGRVEVIADIDSTTPISDSTVAQLNLQGVTGLLYIDLLEQRGASGRTVVKGLKYPVIRSRPSRFDAFLSGLPEVLDGAGRVMERANRLLADDNLAAVSATLANIDRATRSLPQTLHDLGALVNELRGASADLAQAARSARVTLDAAAPQVQAATGRLRDIALHLDSASAELDGLLRENRGDVRRFARDGLPEIERFVREGRAAATDIRALSNSLRDNPAQLLYQPPQRGVEIPR
ncbi:MAG: MCE family protein [Proteobacteria bacterium]|nr:MCE family protein [Pseudomonadota bacterium]